jgi:hypothetical protein
VAENAHRKLKSPYDRRLDRARALMEQTPAARDLLLLFYIDLAHLQKQIFEQTDSEDLSPLLPWFPELFIVVAPFAVALYMYARQNLASERARLALLKARWEGDADRIDPRASFFANAILQPFAESLAAPSVRRKLDRPGMPVLQLAPRTRHPA